MNRTDDPFANLILSHDGTIRDAMTLLDANAREVVLVRMCR